MPNCRYCECILITTAGRTWCGNAECPGNVGVAMPTRPVSELKGDTQARLESAIQEIKDARKAISDYSVNIVNVPLARGIETLAKRADGFMHDRAEALRVARNVCRIFEIDYEAAKCLATEKTVLTPEEIEYAQKEFGLIDTGDGEHEEGA